MTVDELRYLHELSKPYKDGALAPYHQARLNRALKEAELADVYAHVIAELGRWSHVTVEVLYSNTIYKLRLDGFTVDAPDEKNERLRYQITISGWD